MTADIAVSLKDWSATAASNQPDNSDAVGPNILAENQRTIQAVVRAALAGSDTIASATTTDIGAKDANYLAVSGTTTITGLGTVSAGIVKILKFDGALTFTHNGTSLILPGAANITTAAGDVAVMRSEGSGNWRCLSYQRASSAADFSSNTSTSVDGEIVLFSGTGGKTGKRASTTGILKGTSGVLSAAVAGTDYAAPGANGDITSLTACTALTNTAGIDIKGTNTNDDAAAGYVGEYIESILPLASAVSMSTGVAANITSISLTAGDWDVCAEITTNPAATTSISQVRGSISTTSATPNVTAGRAFGHSSAAQVPGGNSSFYASKVVRLSLSSTTTVYLVADATFTVSTLSIFGIISARRVR